jgi:hypothetical protein
MSRQAPSKRDEATTRQNSTQGNGGKGNNTLCALEAASCTTRARKDRHQLQRCAQVHDPREVMVEGNMRFAFG